MTAQFVQPKTKTYGTVKAVKVKAIAYKSKSKLPLVVKRGKAKSKKGLTTPERQLQTVNARAAKAQKRAQRQASSSSSAPKTGSKMARKSVTSDAIYSVLNRAGGRSGANQASTRTDQELVELFDSDDENSAEEDEDEEEVSEEDESDTGNDYIVPDTESEQEASAEEESDRAARGSRLRNSLEGVAMRQRNRRGSALQASSSSARTGRHGGRREGAGRKRKRHSDV